MCASHCDASAFPAHPTPDRVWTLKALQSLYRVVSDPVTSSHKFRGPIVEVSSVLVASRPNGKLCAMTVPARVKQADIARALREAQKIGAKRVKIGADGSIDIVLETEEQVAALPDGRHDEPMGPIRIRDRPKKKVVL